MLDASHARLVAQRSGLGADADAAYQEVVRLRTAGAPFADRLEGLLPAVVEAAGLLTPPRQVQLCHGDLWTDSVRRTPGRRTPGGRSVWAVRVDRENSGPGDVNGEPGCALVEYGVDKPDRIRSLYAAYRGAGGRGQVAEYLDEPVTLAKVGGSSSPSTAESQASSRSAALVVLEQCHGHR